MGRFSGLTIQDEVRAYLQEKSQGNKYISVDGLGNLISGSKMDPQQFRRGFYGLLRKGEIETDTIESEGGRKTVKGISLIKMPAVSTIVRNEAEKKKIQVKAAPKLKASMELPNIIDYLTKKNAIVEIRAKLESLGFKPDEVTNFPIDPMGEEAIALLDLVGQAQAALSQVVEERDRLMIDLAAEKEINKRYSDGKKITSEEMSHF